MAYGKSKRSGGSNRKSGRASAGSIKRGVSRGQTVKLVIEHVTAQPNQLPPGVLQIAQATSKAKL